MTYFFDLLTFESIKKRDDFAIAVLSLLLMLWLSLWLLPRYVSFDTTKSNTELEQVEVSPNYKMSSQLTFPLK